MLKSFSVIVPVLNLEKLIIRTLQSIEDSIIFFHSHYEGEPVEAEVVVVNEGSKDGTLAVIREFSQDKPHYKIVNHFRALGIGPARNTGAKVAKGDILFFFDGDDLVLPEHIYVCFRLLNHRSPGTDPTLESFPLETQRGSLTVPLPKTAVGIVRTGVYMQEQLHPHWKAAIENTIMQNVAVRRECHEFAEGFPESPVYKQIGSCEDIAYGTWTNKFFKLCKIDLETVEYIRYPGNNFDRQLPKFQTPPEQYVDDTPPAMRELHMIRMKLEQEKLAYLADKLNRMEKPPALIAILNWQQLALEHVSQQRYPEAIYLLEQGMALEPESADAVKNLLTVAHNNLGSSFRAQGNLDQAANHFQRAITVSGTLPGADLARIHYNLGTVLRDQGKLDEAIGSLEQAIAVETTFPEAIAELRKLNDQRHIHSRNYQFVPSDFIKQVALWEQHLSRFARIPEIKALEIGSGDGRSACWLLDHILIDASARLTCIDWFTAPSDQGVTDAGAMNLEALFDANIAKTAHPEQVRKIVGTPTDVLRSLIPNSFHLVHLSGSSVASDVLESTLLVWHLLKQGGILIFDHYESSQILLTDKPARVAIDAFLNIFSTRIKVLHQGVQVFVEKITA